MATAGPEIECQVTVLSMAAWVAEHNAGTAGVAKPPASAAAAALQTQATGNATAAYVSIHCKPAGVQSGHSNALPPLPVVLGSGLQALASAAAKASGNYFNVSSGTRCTTDVHTTWSETGNRTEKHDTRCRQRVYLSAVMEC